MYIYGGVYTHSGGTLVLHDLVGFDLESETWHTYILPENNPGPRRDHCLVAIGSHCVALLGGKLSTANERLSGYSFHVLRTDLLLPFARIIPPEMPDLGPLETKEARPLAWDHESTKDLHGGGSSVSSDVDSITEVNEITNFEDSDIRLAGDQHDRSDSETDVDSEKANSPPMHTYEEFLCQFPEPAGKEDENSKSGREGVSSRVYAESVATEITVIQQVGIVSLKPRL